MGEWHDVELLCPICRTWERTGAATTLANFASDAPAVLGGRVFLSCGHDFNTEDHRLRVGSEIPFQR